MDLNSGCWVTVIFIISAVVFFFLFRDIHLTCCKHSLSQSLSDLYNEMNVFRGRFRNLFVIFNVHHRHIGKDFRQLFTQKHILTSTGTNY